MKYLVTIAEFGDAADSRATWHYFNNLTLKQAWRIAEKHARRGFNRHGGKIEKQNWGMRGGAFPNAYRSAVIKLDNH